MTKEEAIQEFKRLTEEMKGVVDQLHSNPLEEQFSGDWDITNSDEDFLARVRGEYAEPTNDPPGYARFVDDDFKLADELHGAWLRASIQLIQRMANPHLSKDDLKVAINGIRMLFDLHVEKLGVE